MSPSKVVFLGPLCLILVIGGCGGRSIGVDPPGSCTTDCTFEIHHLETDFLDMWPVPLQVSQGWVLYTRSHTTGNNAAGDPEIFGVNASTRTVEQFTFNDTHTRLLDAHGRALLYTESETHYGDPLRLYYQPATGPRVVLGEYERVLDRYSRNFYTSARQRYIHGRNVTWSADGRVFLFDGATTQVIAELENGGVVSPYIEGNTVVFSAWDGDDHEVYRWTEGVLEQLTDNDSVDELPVISAGRIFWNCDDRLCLWEAGATRVLDTGVCSEADTHLGQAAWLCDDQVRFFDGLEVRTVETELLPIAVRLSNGRLVWVEADWEDIWECYDGVGMIRYWDGLRAWDVAPVGLPCMCCDAYWPPLELSFAGDLIAWSYALNPDYPEDPPYWYDGAFCAWARITEHTTCPQE